MIDKRVIAYFYEAMTLHVAASLKYTPDWIVYRRGGGGSEELEFHEVKGAHIREKDWIRFKLAVEKFPRHTFVLAQKALDKDGGAWTIRTFNDE